jgi:S-adenosylmethionine:tRNA ribosyltransferase-isomerase
LCLVMTPLSTDDYNYSLPPDRIAVYPLEARDQSNLLVYDKGQISHTRFDSLAAHLPSQSFLFFNDTKVIPARLHFTKGTGAEIEIFLLNPIHPSPLMIQAMQAQHNCSWKCAIGNLKRWKDGIVLSKNLGRSLFARP